MRMTEMRLKVDEENKTERNRKKRWLRTDFEEMKIR
jgi:hypothetical protein